MQKIITVEDTFSIEGRGLVVTGWKENSSVNIKMNDLIEILRPDGTTIKSQIAGVERFVNRKYFSESSETENIGFLLKDLSKKDVPKNSIISLVS